MHRTVYLETPTRGTIADLLERSFPIIEERLHIRIANINSYLISVKLISSNIPLNLSDSIRKFSREIKNILVRPYTVIELKPNQSDNRVERKFTLHFRSR
jgi:hypothetical protein